MALPQNKGLISVPIGRFPGGILAAFVAAATLHYALAQKTSASLQGLGPTDVFCAKA